MARVVSDDVKRKVWLFQPVSDHGLLPGGDPAVQISAEEDRCLAWHRMFCSTEYEEMMIGNIANIDTL